MSPEPTSATPRTEHQIVARCASNIGVLFVSAPWLRPVTCGETIGQLMQDIHELNVRKGWWTDLGTGERAKRNFGELLMLVVSEIAEGFEGHIEDRLDDKLPTRSMLEVELADAIIRICDTAEGFELPLPSALAAMSQADRALVARTNGPIEQMMSIVLWLAEAMEADRKRKGAEVKARFIGLAVLQIISIGLQFNLDVPGALHEKLLFNIDRQDHNLEVRKAGGLKY